MYKYTVMYTNSTMKQTQMSNWELERLNFQLANGSDSKYEVDEIEG